MARPIPLPSGFILAILTGLGGGCASSPQAEELAGEPAGEVLVRAEKALADKDQDRARTLLESLEDRKLRPAEQEKHLFLQAVAHYQENEGWRCFQKLELLASRFPVSVYAPQAAWLEFQAGKAMLDSHGGFLGLFSDRSYGLRILKHLVITWPQQAEPGNPRNVLADDALALIADDHWESEEWEDAALRYNQLIRDYPDSEWATLAAFRVGQAWFRRIQGPRYDMGLMAEAERELALFIRSGRGTPLQKQESAAALGKVREWLAERGLFLGRYYITVGSPEGAALHLDEVVRLYPGTRAAVKAAELLPEWREAALKKRAESREAR